MNLFLLGIGLKGDQGDRIAPSVSAAAGIFSSLDNGQDYTWQSSCKSTALACRLPAQELLGSREYVCESDDFVCAFDGLPVDDKDRFTPHVASDLARHWDDRVNDLDGFFCGIRILKQSRQIELQLDSFGVHPIYYWNDGDTWVISNSIAALDQFRGEFELDPTGVGRFLAMGWMAGNRTLRQGVRAFPAGEHWTWHTGKSAPQVRQVARQVAIAGKKKSKLSRADTVKLSEDLAIPLKSLHRDIGNLMCPLTGGKDSRMLAALLANNGIPARYYTYGNQVGVDGEIASTVAAELGIEHENLLTDSTSLLANWDAEIENFILQGDGMSPVQLVMSTSVAERVATQPLSVRIAGGGGALGRATYFNPLQEFRGATIADIQENIGRRFVSDSGGMMRPEATRLARASTDNAISRYAEQGFHPQDINDAFYLYERGGRRTGQVMHTTTHLRDSYSPYFSRALVAAIFSLDIKVRRTEAVHYQLIEALAPQVLHIRCESGPWKSRSASRNYYHELLAQIRRRIAARIERQLPARKHKGTPAHFIVKDTMFERVKWLQQLQPRLREMCLDSHNSIIWDFVNRSRFEAALETTESLSSYARSLFIIATIHYYESLSQARRLKQKSF